MRHEKPDRVGPQEHERLGKESAEARVRELEDSVALSEQLAAANALLCEVKTLLHRVHGFQVVGMSGERAFGLERDIKAIFPALHAHLSAQPAAPLEACEHGNNPCSLRDPFCARSIGARQPSAPTDHERAVLEAAAALSTESLYSFGKPSTTPWVRFAHAELARREAKR